MDNGISEFSVHQRNHRGAVNTLFVDSHATALAKGAEDDLYVLEPGSIATGHYGGSLRGW